MQHTNFETLYSQLQPQLAKLKGQQAIARTSGVLTRIFEVYFITLIVSFFLGFLNMFPFEEFPGAVANFFQYFMLSVLSLVVIGIVNKQIKKQLGEKNIKLAQNNFLVITITLVISAIVLVGGYYAGTAFLGGEGNISFFIKWTGGIFSIFVLMVPYMVIKKIENNFNASYSTVIMDAFLPSSKSPITYSPKEYVHESEFAESKIFNYKEISSYEGSKLFKRNEFNFHGSNLYVKQIETSTSNGKTETKISDLFKGYFFVATFNKKFAGETYIFPDTSRSIFGDTYGEMFNKWAHRKQTKLVTMENVQFEKLFSVYASDETEARYILSVKLLERITSLKDIFYQNISLSFIDNKVFIAVQADKDLFSPNLYGKLDDHKYLEKQYQYFLSLLSIPETFDLQTHVWD